jgi:ABC-2 type transport system ATP-binding protein
MVTGFLAPSEGSARVLGHDVVADSLAAQRVIGYLPEGAPAYGDMTPRSFLRFISRVRALSGAAADTAIANAVAATELQGVLDQPIDTLSKGFRRRVGLAQAILHNPPVLIMDEPTDGLDPNQKHEVRKLIARMAADKAIIISTHILEEVDAICTRALIIDRGTVVADGTPAELISRSRYHNAVTLTIDGQLTVAAAELLKAIPGVASMEVIARGTETVLTIFTARGTADAPVAAEVDLIDRVAGIAREQGWPMRALYGEPGRLDEVFRSLTRSDTADAGKSAA